MRRTLVSWGLAALALAGCGGSGPNASLSLRRVILYQNGLGYFERSGRIEGDRFPLRFGAHEVDDVLSTLAVVDAAGGETVVSASVPQRQPGEGDDGEVTLDLRLPDRRARDLVMTYAVPTPAWRAAYRVVLPDGTGEGEALFQIWALVHNASPEDWNGVELALATAAPMSYSIDLRTPEFVERPDATGHMVAPTLSGTVVASRSRGERDGDGIADADDLCPGESEDFDGFEDADGCADRDNDADRIADADDQCPGEAETYNGAADDDGCPDRGRVVVEESNITILDQIYFERGRSSLRESSLPIVDATAATLAGNPNITAVDIEGHASDDESDAWSISAERASAVRAALVARGVAGSRLRTRPMGSTQPVAAGTSASARERNRRVAFRIVETSDGPVSGGAEPAVQTAGADRRVRAGYRLDDLVTVESLGRSSVGRAMPVESEGTTRYDVGAAVSVPAHSSSLVTILSERVRGEAILLYRPDAAAPGSESHPFRAARIESPRTTTLIPGPVAIYAGGSFAGEGLVDALHEGEIAMLPYAIDGSTQVVTELERGSEPARLVSLARGVLTVEDRSIRRTRYTVRPGAHVPSRIFVDHERASGHSARNLPPGTEEGEASLLVPVPITASTESTIAIEEVTPVRRSVTMLSDLATPLAPYLEASGLPTDVMQRLSGVLDQRRALGELEERVASLRERIEDASTRSAELRENLRALGTRASETRRTLEARLREASTQVESLSRELADAQAQAAEARAALSAALTDLTLGTGSPP
jgi:outer membrane protein OmpA-like peptidoglycan-associated protein